MGVVISLFCAPTYFKRSKYVVLRKKGLLRHRALFDDGATGLFTMIAYTLIGWTFLTPYLIMSEYTTITGVMIFLILSSYIFSFSGFLEFFRLGRFRNNKIYFVTVLLVWWVFAPWMLTLMFSYKIFDDLILASVSPLFGLGAVIGLIVEKSVARPSSFLVPGMIAVVMWLLVWREHALLEKQHGKENQKR